MPPIIRGIKGSWFQLSNEKMIRVSLNPDQSEINRIKKIISKKIV
jgi:hypothetical protein